ncbi:hypothetical protein [Phenylobacterium sp.]|uniref:hypothetical protein n=1 Tax=Phenylobacterium sp. TaxID=1871053 RepID=UPI0035C841DB
MNAWLTIATAALGSSLFASVLTAYLSHLLEVRRERGSEQRSRDQEATVSALLLADALEGYALVCADRASEALSFLSSGGKVGEQIANVPALAPYSAEVYWQSLGADIAAEAIAIRREVDIASRKLSGLWNIGPDEALDEAPKATLRLGMRAWQGAQKVRSGFKLPALDRSKLAWDYIQTLEEALAKGGS